MAEGNKSLETLQVWKKAIDFAVLVHREIILLLPNEEKWALASQLRRAAQSISANIAEGYGRYGYQDNIRFCYMARGSLTETYSHITMAYKLEYLEQQVYKRFTDELDELRKMLNGYIAYLKKRKRNQD